MSLLLDKQIIGLKIHDMFINEDPLGQVKCVQSYWVKFACQYIEARDSTDNFNSWTLLELMYFEISQLSYYVCCG